MGVTEPTTGTDTTRIRTTAVKKGDRYVVNGQKVFISRVRHSDLMILLARTTPLADVGRKSEGMSIFLVDLHEAVRVGLPRDVDLGERALHRRVELARAARAAAAVEAGLDQTGGDQLVEVEAHRRQVEPDVLGELCRSQAHGGGQVVTGRRGAGQGVEEASAHGRGEHGGGAEVVCRGAQRGSLLSLEDRISPIEPHSRVGREVTRFR